MIKSVVDFKTDRLRREFFIIHPLLRGAVYEMGHIVYYSTNSLLVVTSLIRSRKENEEIGGKPLSSHLFARAADCRTRNLPAGNFIGNLIARIKYVYGSKIHIIRHTGTADHIHLNVNFPYADEFTEVYYDSHE